MKQFQPITWKDDSGAEHVGVYLGDMPGGGVLARNVVQPLIDIIVKEPHRIKDHEKMREIWKTMKIPKQVLLVAGFVFKAPEKTAEELTTVFDKALAELDSEASKIHLKGFGIQTD